MNIYIYMYSIYSDTVFIQFMMHYVNIHVTNSR